MNSVSRPIEQRYSDPLTLIWEDCASRVGFRIERTPEVYASSNGRGTIFIGADALLDADDTLAQMIFHELCHALVEGEPGEGLQDWGLDNITNRHRWREHACLRLQAYLAGIYGLREFFAPTTDFRVTFWNDIPDDPFFAPEGAGGRRDPSCVAGRIGAWRATQPRWALPLQEALVATAAIAACVKRQRTYALPTVVGMTASARSDDPVAGTQALPELWDVASCPPALHPAGHAVVAGYHSSHACEDCAWSFRSRGATRCRHAPAIRLPAQAPACIRWEARDSLNCGTCGACCREAYQSVEVSPSERINRSHPELIHTEGTRRKLRRDGVRCAALAGGTRPEEPFRCSVYNDRPRSCRDFALGGCHCLDARRRVGLSL